MTEKIELEKNDNGEPICPNCGLLMMPQWENVGFQEPDPSKYEITGYLCPNCGHKED